VFLAARINFRAAHFVECLHSRGVNFLAAFRAADSHGGVAVAGQENSGRCFFVRRDFPRQQEFRRVVPPQAFFAIVGDVAFVRWLAVFALVTRNHLAHSLDGDGVRVSGREVNVVDLRSACS
jgi:hypothetical protein